VSRFLFLPHAGHVPQPAVLDEPGYRERVADMLEKEILG
jgi:hypothetical protein